MSDNHCKFTLNDYDPTALTYTPPDPLSAGAHVKDLPGYLKLYDRSLRQDNFWLDIATELYFEKFSGHGLESNFDLRNGPVYTKFLAGSRTNLAYNCLRRIINVRI